MNLKTNSRFSFLKDESNTFSMYKKRSQNNRSPYNRSNYSRSSPNSFMEKNNTNKNENSKFLNKVILENENKEREKQLNIENFPDLLKQTNKPKLSNNLKSSFKESIEKKLETKIVNDLPKGWINITKETIFPPVVSSTEEEINYNMIINNLCKKYEDYTYNYILLWGEEEYKNMYLFPNYEPVYDSDESDTEDEQNSSDSE